MAMRVLGVYDDVPGLAVLAPQRSGCDALGEEPSPGRLQARAAGACVLHHRLESRSSIGESVRADGLLAEAEEVHERRSEARRVGKECVSTCRSRLSP